MNHPFRKNLLLSALLCALLTHPALAQRPIIVETGPPPPPKPKPKPKPLFTKPKLLWRTSLGRVEANPALSGDTLFLGAGEFLYQLDSGGRSQWRAEIGPQLSAPVFDSQRVYIGSDKGSLTAFTRKSGIEAWKFVADGNAAILSRPTLGAGRVYFEATDNNVYGLDAASGQLRWKFLRSDGSLGYSSPVYEDGAIFVCGETTVYRLDAASGNETWKAYVGGKSLSTPVSGDARLYVGGDGTGLVALSPANGNILWTFTGKMPGDWFGTPFFSNGVVYVSTYNRYVYAVDAATGKQKWSYRLLGSALAAPVLDVKRNALYVASTTFRDNPTLTAIDSKTGKKLWDYPMGYVTSSPLLTDDKLYIGSTNGYLYAFGLK